MDHARTKPSDLSPEVRNRLRAIRPTLQSGDAVGAASQAEAALRDGVRHPFLFNTLAMQLEAAGRLDASEARLREGLELAPDDPGCLHALGLLLLRQERPDEAQAAFERVLEKQPDFAPALVALGQALEAAGLLPAAEARYRAALEKQPGNLLARAGLASGCGRRGDRAAAREHGLAVLAADPNSPPAALVVAEAEIGDGELVAAEERLRALIAEPRVSAVERSLGLSTLGDSLDRQDRTAEGFAAYRESNELRRAFYAADFRDRRTLDYAQAL